jgi:hypothetical protein
MPVTAFRSAFVRAGRRTVTWAYPLTFSPPSPAGGRPTRRRDSDEFVCRIFSGTIAEYSC